MEALIHANEARAMYLAQIGQPPPIEFMRLTSLLEYILGDDLPGAIEYHEKRLAVILEQAIATLPQQMEEAKNAQARSILLGGR